MRRARPLFAAAVAVALLAGLAALGLDRGWWHLNHPNPAIYPVRGIDVSRHQGPIDWAAVARTPGVRFAYLKATEGGDWTDPRFLANWEAARRAGLKVGAYHFFTFCRPAEEQARHFLAVVPREPDALPPAVDVEYGGNCKAVPPPEVVRQELEEWLDLVAQAHGRQPIIYAAGDAMDDFLGGAALPNRLWVRSLVFAPRAERWLFWQYDARGEVAGIDGPVDLNVFRGAPEALDRL